MSTTKACHIRLPEGIVKRYEELARHTGRTKTFYMRQAIVNHIADLEDAYAGAVVMEHVRRGEEELIPLADWEARQTGQ